MYAVSHGAFRVHAWHVFVTYLLVTWLACAAVCLFDKWMPMLNKVGIFVTVTGLLVTITVCAVGPSRHGELGHASNATVWTGWTADIGYPDGFAFALGMLNAAYAMGTPDSTSHLAEEILNPSRNVPKAMAMQYVIGFISGLAYLITILYAINDLDALLVSAYPIAEIYHQATGSSSGTIGLLFLLLLPTLICVISVYLTCGRTIWALARDGATPFPKALSKVDPKLRVPAIATLTCCALASVMGCIYVGSSTAFNAFVGSFVLMSSSSYIASLLPLLLRGRKGIRFGCFRLNSLGFPLNVVSCGYLITWFVIYCFPYSLPTSAKSMNYSCLIWGGLTILIALWWIVHARYHYPGISVPASQVAVL
jgi:amino acid transporter